MEKYKIKANLRTATGNGPARVLRREGLIPAVLYGPDTESVLLSVSVRALEQALKTASVGQLLVDLVIENGKTVTKTAMIKELQSQPVSGSFLHIDFFEVAMDRKIKVNVPVVTTGLSKGVELGGMLQIVRHELEVFCLPNEIPESIEIDVTELDIGDSVHVQELPLGDNIEIPADVNFTVLTVLSQKMEEEEEEEVDEELEGEELEEGEAEGEPDSEE